ncbi:MAG: YceI family protein [Pacificimonas sp.]
MRTAFIASAAAIILAAPLVAYADNHDDNEAAPELDVAKDGATLAAAMAMPAGTYNVDAGHTLASFTFDHLGISSYTGQFGNPSGTLTIDPADPTAAKVDITFAVADVSTTSEELDQHLQSADFFDAASHPDIRFVSTDVVIDGGSAEISGNLTMHGVTKPVTLRAKLFGAKTNPMNNMPSLGFTAMTTIRRSDFGLTTYLPALGDEVKLDLDAAFEMVAPDA